MARIPLLRSLIADAFFPFDPSPSGFIPTMAIVRYVKGRKKILIVGDLTGRDHRVLTRMGKELYVVDIAAQSGVPNFVRQSITVRTPFVDQFFDAVIVAEVMEHLFEDVDALREIRRILKDDGALIVTVPYFSNIQDMPEYHVRVHSRKTMNRLLNYVGFEVRDHFYRGLMVRLPHKNIATRALVFGSRVALAGLLGRKGAGLFRRICFGIEHSFGTSAIAERILRRSSAFGGIMLARKASPVDFAALQVAEFSNQWKA